MKLYLAVALLCVVAANALPNKSGKKGGAACKADPDCKKHACTPAGPSTCDRSAKKCVCAKHPKKTSKLPKTTTAAATTAADETTPEPEARSAAPTEEAGMTAAPADGGVSVRAGDEAAAPTGDGA
ncbi:Atrochrysone carboxylic acid synthase [Frankliniella fusca]|uniref:Atrochrysone carboxylic acid synthase n=1 Tax=Frankliniella fusca TaxID=407009 RepID=A0AAE1GVM9_9NEOP|nr:Atrochrysone carboxylic acid synthase [Frankliniella fusca]